MRAAIFLLGVLAMFASGVTLVGKGAFGGGWGSDSNARTAAAVDSLVDLHWSPAENLERVDVWLIGSSRKTIDIAAFVLTDYAVVKALRERANAGVRVRLLLDVGELAHLLARNSDHPLRVLSRQPNVQVKVKAQGAAMHLKTYVGDGELLRFGSANFFASGLKHQDNELAIVRDRAMAQRFAQAFEALWNRPDNTSWRGE